MSNYDDLKILKRKISSFEAIESFNHVMSTTQGIKTPQSSESNKKSNFTIHILQRNFFKFVL